MIYFYRKVKLKIKRDDSPRQVSTNFAKIYGLNLRSEEALAKIITEQVKKEKHSRKHEKVSKDSQGSAQNGKGIITQREPDEEASFENSLKNS